jgi:hypothetical protein
MDEVGDFQDNIRSLNVFGGNFTDVKGDHYHIRGNFLNREPESGRGERLLIIFSEKEILDLTFGCNRD